MVLNISGQLQATRALSVLIALIVLIAQLWIKLLVNYRKLR